MNKIVQWLCTATLAMSFLTGCCCRNTDDVWDDTKTAGRYFSRGFQSLVGSPGDSRMVRCPEDFCGRDGSWNGWQDDFVAIPDQDFQDEIAMAEMVAPQPKESPGDPGSSVPGIESFKDPHTMPGLSNIFANVCFGLNSNLVKGQDNFATLRKITDYLQKHPNTYVFIEGHCCERGTAAYNLALGSRRANAVRASLIQEGVDPNRLFTISYGKERPLLLDHHEEARAVNRRAEFKIYQR